MLDQQADPDTVAEIRRTTSHGRTSPPASVVGVVPHELRDTASDIENSDIETPDHNDSADGEPEPAHLPWTTLTLEDARRRLATWHFAKEALSAGEKQIVHVAEALFRLIDERDARPHNPKPSGQQSDPSRSQVVATQVVGDDASTQSKHSPIPHKKED